LIDEIRIDERRLPPGTRLAAPLADVGTEVAPPPAGHVWGRYAMVVVTGDSVADCRSALDAANEAVSVVPRTR